jgi:hypothetical protein
MGRTSISDQLVKGKEVGLIDQSFINLDPIVQFFEFEHLPDHLQRASKPFADLAMVIVQTVPRNAERTVSLRKLLEAKDCAVRALIYKG